MERPPGATIIRFPRASPTIVTMRLVLLSDGRPQIEVEDIIPDTPETRRSIGYALALAASLLLPAA